MKKRLDVLLAERGLMESRQKAQAAVMSGQVYAAGRRLDKPGMSVPEEIELEIRGEPPRYVSRGGLKLEKALCTFPVTLKNAVCADIGASTGGFTDCMLQNGAAKVYAVDVGYGQLAWKLRTNPAVICLERTNARYLTTEQIPETLDFASVDVSFISLSKILPALRPLLKPSAQAVCLIKPQFEAGRDKVGKRGVVRDQAVHAEVLSGFLTHAAQADFTVTGLTWSPVRGPEGNIEYLGCLVPGNIPVSGLPENTPVPDLPGNIPVSGLPGNTPVPDLPGNTPVPGLPGNISAPAFTENVLRKLVQASHQALNPSGPDTERLISESETDTGSLIPHDAAAKGESI